MPPAALSFAFPDPCPGASRRLVRGRWPLLARRAAGFRAEAGSRRFFSGDCTRCRCGRLPGAAGIAGIDLSKQTDAMAMSKSTGCIQCHHTAHDPHERKTVKLGCVDCHGGDPTTSDKHRAHDPAPPAGCLGFLGQSCSHLYTFKS